MFPRKNDFSKKIFFGAGDMDYEDGDFDFRSDMNCGWNIKTQNIIEWEIKEREWCFQLQNCVELEIYRGSVLS